MKKLLATACIALAALAFTAPTFVTPAHASNTFRAIGGSNRGWDGSRLLIHSTDSGRSYTFYGTPRSCPGRVGDRYDSMSWVMNGNPFYVSITPCGRGMVWVRAWDDYGNSASSGYAINYEPNYTYY